MRKVFFTGLHVQDEQDPMGGWAVVADVSVLQSRMAEVRCSRLYSGHTRCRDLPSYEEVSFQASTELEWFTLHPCPRLLDVSGFSVLRKRWGQTLNTQGCAVDVLLPESTLHVAS